MPLKPGHLSIVQTNLSFSVESASRFADLSLLQQPGQWICVDLSVDILSSVTVDSSSHSLETRIRVPWPGPVCSTIPHLTSFLSLLLPMPPSSFILGKKRRRLFLETYADLICRDSLKYTFLRRLGISHFKMVYWKSQRARSIKHFLQYCVILPLGLFP